MVITVNQAYTAHQEGRLKEAERLYRSILENQPTNLDANNNLGVLLQNLGRLDEAEVSYKKAIEIKPDYVEAYFGRCHLEGTVISKDGTFFRLDSDNDLMGLVELELSSVVDDLIELVHTKSDEVKVVLKMVE